MDHLLWGAGHKPAPATIDARHKQGNLTVPRCSTAASHASNVASNVIPLFSSDVFHKFALHVNSIPP